MGRQLIAASAGDYSGGFGMAEISSIVDNFSKIARNQPDRSEPLEEATPRDRAIRLSGNPL